MTASALRAETDLDLFDADFVTHLFDRLADLREQSSVVYSTMFDFYVFTRYEDVRAALGDWETYSSAQGVALTPEINYAIEGSILSVDPPDHTVLRDVLQDQLAPRGLRRLRAGIKEYASRLVAEQVARGEFDAVVDITRVFPVHVVCDLLGLPQEGRDTLQPGADAMFAAFGPWGDYLLAHLQEMADYNEWLNTMGDRDKMLPGGWGHAILDAADAGKISPLAALRLINGYLTAGMDTTVNALAATIRLFAERSEVWAALKSDPSLAAPIFEEVMRVESPLLGFWRVTTRDVKVDGTLVPAGSKVMLNLAAANHDPAKYEDPDEFRIDRNPFDHVAFGYGNHSCAGQGLARMEAVTLLEALAEQVDTIELAGEPVQSMNPIVRGLESVPVRVTAA